ncbi:MAG: alpha/beta hydrolase [Chloroflexota bacterium]
MNNKHKLSFVLFLLLALVAGNVVAQDEASAPTVYALPQYEVEVTTHVYAQGLTHDEWRSESAEEMDLLLDVYEPIGAPDNRPAMIVIHGGAFRLGSRDDGRFVRMSEYFASRGWVTISIDYRLVQDYGTIPLSWQQGVQEFVDPSAHDETMAIYTASRDAKAAVRWFYANADEYQINTDYITALGMSAGASLAIMLGTTDAELYRDELSLAEDPTLISTNLEQPADVHTVVAFSMTPAANTLMETIYGINTFDETDAPLMIMNGTDDRLVDINEADMLSDQYEETGVPHAYYRIEGAGHSLQMMNAEVDGMQPMELGFAFVVEQQDLIVID